MGTLREAVERSLSLDPNVKYRGNFLPFVKNQDDSISFGWPGAALGLAEALMLPGHVAQGGSYTPGDVANAALMISPAGIGAGRALAPAGSFAMGASGKRTILKDAMKGKPSRNIDDAFDAASAAIMDKSDVNRVAPGVWRITADTPDNAMLQAKAAAAHLEGKGLSDKVQVIPDIRTNSVTIRQAMEDAGKPTVAKNEMVHGITVEQRKNLYNNAVKASRMGGMGVGKKTIGKSVRDSGVSESNIQEGKSLLKEIFDKIVDRRNNKNIVDPLVIKNSPNYRNYKLSELKDKKTISELGKKLGWRKDSIEDVLNSKRIGYDFEGSVKRATLESIEREAKKRGYSTIYSSGKRSSKNASSFYLKSPDGEIIRVSDHELPMTAQREYEWRRKGGPSWNSEYILDDLENKSLDDIFREIEMGGKK